MSNFVGCILINLFFLLFQPMPDITIKRVETRKDLKRFIEFHYDLYKGNEYDAPVLFSDDLNTLSKDKNAAFEFCEAEYFLAYKEGKLVGRVAAIINHKANTKWDRKVVRFGWIDFIDDINVSTALLKAVEDYGRSKGMTELVGPLGFTDMDPEGMLIWGFEELGTLATIYNYPYYPEHLERIGGFEKDNDYVEFKLYIPKEVPEKYAKIASMIQKRYNLHVKHLTRNEVFKEGYGKRVFSIINECFQDLYSFSELTERQIDQYVEMYLPMADLNLITIIEDWNFEPHKMVGVGITMPSLTKALQKCHKGRLWPFGWWHLLRAIKWHKTNIVDLYLVGILPEYRKKGANALLFSDLIPQYVNYGFEWGETNVEMETNTNVQSQWSILDPVMHKRRRCFKKNI